MTKSMTQLHKLFIVLIVILTSTGLQPLLAQNNNKRVTVPIADPSRPIQLRVHLLNGSITVKGADVKEVIVEAKSRDDGDGDGSEGRRERRRDSDRSEGMKRIPMTSSGLNIESENNQVRVSTDAINRTADLIITVPVRTSASLHTVNGGNITVTGVDGELDVNNVNGAVTLKDISGSAVAHALNGRVLVTFVRADSKPMAFSSLNGNIDVTFPAGFKANVSMRTDNGEVYSDFDVALTTTTPQQTVEDNRTSQGGKYRVKVDKTVRGTINGGGPEIQFKNFNGNIYIRKAGNK